MRFMRSLRLALLPCVSLLAACQSAAIETQAAATAPIPQLSLLSSSPMPQGIPARDAPPGFISFCSRYLDQCVASASEPATVHLDLPTQGVLDSVNRAVNNAIVPEDDQEHYGRAEYWNIPSDGYGNCKDYALTKRKVLIAAGLPERALRVAIVVTARENRHAVLTVATDRGDLVLDNLSNTLKPWSDVNYRWVERQDGSGSLGWVAFDTQVAENGAAGPTAETK